MIFSQMFGKAKWVAPSGECTAPVIAGKFSAKNVKKAEIVICGLGFFRLWINGKEVSDDKLVPANSQYCERDLSQFEYPILDTLSYRTYCMKYDITNLLREGENVLHAVLGTGWFAQNKRGAEGKSDFGDVKLCYKIDLTLENGETQTVVSDENLKWKQSRIVFNNLYLGEIHDLSLSNEVSADEDFSDYEPVVIAPSHDCEFYIQTCPADRAVRSVIPKKIKDFGEYSIYDAGENISGYAVVAAKCDGEEIHVRYSEEINEDCSLNFDSCGWEHQIQQETFKNAKADEPYEPWFTWHGFRYFELSNNAEPIRCDVVNADVPVTSEFESDNEILNWIYDAYIRTQLSNMHAGVPSDCPHIERLGYTGDGQLCCEAVMLLTDSKKFFEKWLWDISDCQDINNGHIQHTAPFAGGGGGPAGWGGAIVVVPYMFYKTYGDKAILREFLPKMLKYFDYMQSRTENGLVCREEEGGWCLGDWCPPEWIQISEPYVNTCLYIKFMYMAQEIAAVLGESERTQYLDEFIAKAKRAVEVAYYSPQTHSFIGDVQGANSFALDIGMGDERTFENTAKKYASRGEYDTGIFGTDILTRILFERGEDDTAFSLLTSKGEASFYNMMKHGATTLWENWDGERSHSHPMFGAVTRYLFTFILGIGQSKDSAGFEDVVIAPHIPEKLGRASGSITTVRGKISVSFEKSDDGIDFEVDVPCEAKFKFGSKQFDLDSGKNSINIKI
ncbi:MAG: family 78 glycoside hydrolase catalytic domain [Clostridia bacterium]|nr:family 78 glycoside hydrolase catalytic domain [Clostridia bacterium]